MSIEIPRNKIEFLMKSFYNYIIIESKMFINNV